MSVFDPTTGEDTTPGNTGDTQDTTPENFLDKIVADKGENWKDPEVIAKGYVHAQAEIARLKELEEKAKEQDYAKTLLEKLQGTATQEPATPTPEPTNTSGSATGETTPQPEDIESLITEALSKRDEETRTQKNLDEVEKLMSDSFGTEAKNVVANKSKELNMSVERLESIAKESPAAFMSLMGAAPTKETNSDVKGTVNPSSPLLQGKDERDSKYYFELMRKQPKEYAKREVQQQMLEDKARLGPRFFN